MIEDKFTLTNQITESKIRTMCKECKCEFNVDLNVLTAKNCSYDLGRALTITCPQCKAAATTTEKESRIRVLTIATDEMRERIQKYRKANRIAFKVMNENCEGDPLQAHMECQMCGYEFMIHLGTGENVITNQAKQSVVIVCPLCDNRDETNKQKAFDQAALATELAKYEQLMQMLNELKKGDGGGKQTVQTTV